jgi:hypothetical protein
LIGFEEIELPWRLVDSMTGETGHRIAGAGVPGLLSQRMPDTVLVGVAGTAELHRVLSKEQRLLTAMGPVTGRALEALVSQMPSLLPRPGTSRVVAPGTHGLELSSQQPRAIPGMRIVAGHAFTASGRHMGERRGDRLEDGLSVAVTTELVHRLEGGEGVGRTGARMAAAAIAALEGSVHRLPEKPALRRGVRIVALMAGRPLHRIAPVGGSERVVGLVTPEADAGTALVEKS